MRFWGIFVFMLAAALTVLAACAPEPLSYTFEDLPPGNVGRGAALFTDHPAACIDCHPLDNSKATGPGVADYGRVAGTRVQGQSPEEYTFNSILRPSKHIVQGYSNVMPSDYDDQLTQQELADLIAYLLSLQEEN